MLHPIRTSTVACSSVRKQTELVQGRDWYDSLLKQKNKNSLIQFGGLVLSGLAGQSDLLKSGQNHQRDQQTSLGCCFSVRHIEIDT